MNPRSAKLLLSALGLACMIAPLAAATADAAKARKHHPHVLMNQVRAEPPTAVYFGAEYLGADPDPRIRHELLRDLDAHFGGNF